MTGSYQQAHEYGIVRHTKKAVVCGQADVDPSGVAIAASRERGDGVPRWLYGGARECRSVPVGVSRVLWYCF